MRLGFKFSNLCGTVHKCGNVLFTSDGNSLISPVGNRVTIFDLVEYAASKLLPNLFFCGAVTFGPFSPHTDYRHKSTTLDIETRSNIARIAVSNNGRILLAVDEGTEIVCRSCSMVTFYSGVPQMVPQLSLTYSVTSWFIG
jgi:periodic tryptophan protein 2